MKMPPPRLARSGNPSRAAIRLMSAGGRTPQLLLGGMALSQKLFLAVALAVLPLPLHAVGDPPALAKDPGAPPQFVGKWTVTFANGVVETCDVRADGTASEAEPKRSADGKAELKENALVISFADDRVERWTAIDKRMVVEHFFPGSEYPSGSRVLGIAAILPADASNSDKGNVQGRWRVVSAEGGGQPEAFAESAGGPAQTTWTFAGDSLTQAVRNPARPGSRIQFFPEAKTAFAFQLDPSKTPRAIDVTPMDGPDKGKGWKGIYLLRDDVLIVCRSKDGGERPTEFSADPKTGRELLFLTRPARPPSKP